MNATRRTSAPYSSAITTMAEAAPGAMPQMAVVPGMTCRRINHQPSALLAAIRSTVVPMNTGQCASTWPS